MSALNSDRSTLACDGTFRCLSVEAAKKIYAGALVMVNSAGNAVPASTATNLTAVGRSELQVDNTQGAAGAQSVRVRRGIFAYANSTGGDAISNANIGQTAYAVDDQTLALTNGTNTRSPVGRIHHVDGDGVWVEIL